jgi:hypothetical protein
VVTDDDDDGQVFCCDGLTALHPSFDPQYGEVWHCSACRRDYVAEVRPVS